MAGDVPYVCVVADECEGGVWTASEVSGRLTSEVDAGCGGVFGGGSAQRMEHRKGAPYGLR